MMMPRGGMSLVLIRLICDYAYKIIRAVELDVFARNKAVITLIDPAEYAGLYFLIAVTDHF